MPDHPVPPDDDRLDGEFEREVDLLRSLAADPVELVDAPAALWGRIEREMSAERQPSAPADDSADESEARGEVVTLDRRRKRRRVVWASVAACLVALAVGVGFLASRSDQSPQQLASARLSAFGGAQVGRAGGQVELVRQDDRLRLRVDMHDLPALPAGNFYEMWLLDPAGGPPVSVGTMRNSPSDVSTSLKLPEGTNTGRYDVVDVSVQQDSAGPQHSGNSVLRGTLTA